MTAVAGRSGGERLKGTYDASAFDGGPEKPTWLTKGQSEIWDSVFKQMPLDALRKRDVYLLAEFCCYQHALQMINADWALNPADKDLRCARTQYTQKLQQISALFGFSPADRKRIQIDKPPEEKDDLDEFNEAE